MFSSLKTRGIIIKRQKYGEADLILTVFTQDLGKIQVLAKSARKGKSKLASALELFNLASLELVRGYHFNLVIGAQCLNSFRILKQDLDRFAWAHFFAEFLNCFSEDKVKDRRLYALFRGLFLNLDRPQKEEWQMRIANGQWRILEYLGIGPRLDACLGCGAVLSGEPFAFLGEGGMYCFICGKVETLHCNVSTKIDSQTLKILKQIMPREGVVAQDFVETQDFASLRGANFALAYFLSLSFAPKIKSLRFLIVPPDKGGLRGVKPLSYLPLSGEKF